MPLTLITLHSRINCIINNFTANRNNTDDRNEGTLPALIYFYTIWMGKKTKYFPIQTYNLCIFNTHKACIKRWKIDDSIIEVRKHFIVH